MKNQVGLNTIDEKTNEISQELMKLGMGRTVALTLAGLNVIGTGATTTDIETISGLCQPEVSIGIRSLREQGWVSETEKQLVGRGRPNKIYTLKVSFDKVLEDIVQKKSAISTKITEDIDKLRRLAHEAEKKNSKIWRNTN